MKWICIFLVVAVGLIGCDSKPKEAIEVPEDLMREIALDIARQTMRTEGMEILSQIKEQIVEQARQEARKVAQLVAAETTNQQIVDDFRMIMEQSQRKTEAMIDKLKKRIENTHSDTITSNDKETISTERADTK